ncbi:ThiF family adenylyltransferase [Actinoplanes sp. NPDC049265]|uniref:ThiF family adenylyltransferase n=1 Tax=Actinoplanes sp. NPDC049265 TaxID=3363902 RepID=UPI003723A03A
MPLQRPVLIPGVPRLRRGPHTLHLGVTRPVLIDLPGHDPAALLDLIDGTRTDRLLISHASRLGIPPPTTRALIETLTAAGLLMPALPREPAGSEAAALAHSGCADIATVLRRRARAVVRVCGEGRLGAGVAVALASAGIGHIEIDLPGAVTAAELPGGPLTAEDVGRPRGEAVAAALSRLTSEIKTSPVRNRAISLQIQLRHREPVALLAASLARRRRPHLLLGLREGVAVVGPFVPASGGPCLLCVDLHRRDRDPGWSEPTTTAEPATVAVLLAATAYAVAEALTFLDGGAPETVGASVDISRPGRHRRRSWHPHPACQCSRERRILR